MRSSSLRVVAGVVAVLVVTALPAVAQTRGGVSSRLRTAVTVEGILEHEEAFQAIADAGTGNRLSGAPGYAESADYVAGVAEAAGLDVSFHEFDYDLDLLADYAAPELAIVSGAPSQEFVAGIAGAQFGGDFGSMYDAEPYAADLTAPVWAADVNLDPGDEDPSNTSGCQAADYEGMPQGAIVLLQDSTACSLGTKFFGAQQFGAGAIVFFADATEGSTEPIWVNVTGIDTPSITVDVATATALANGVEQGDTGVEARLGLDWRPGTYTVRNVVAETRRGDPDQVVVVGAHLDSVGVGPGINDNGSGSATILEIAEHVDRTFPRAKVRFVWFGAEESGLLGSEAYVASLSEAERDDIVAMLNFDMVGSPNFVRFVYDGDLSDSEPPPSGAPEGSAAIEDVFVDYFASQGLASEPTPFSGRSDYGPFIEVGIPAGGLFTGAEDIKTPEQAAVYGGEAGEPYDPCYHLGCDDLDNLDLTALDQMSDAAAHAVAVIARDPRGVLDLGPRERPTRTPREVPPEVEAPALRLQR
jgi:hypothetical protein